MVSSTLETTPEADELSEFLQSCLFSKSLATTIQDIKHMITENFHNLDELLQRIVDEQTALTNLPLLSENARDDIIRDVNFVRQRLDAGKTKHEALQDLKKATAALKRVEDRLLLI